MTNSSDYSVHVYKEQHGYIAISPEWPGLSAFAHTQEAAFTAMQDVIAMGMEVAIEDNEDLPEPAKAEIASSFSGKILLRLPRTLHGLVARQAKRDDTSINTLLIQCIAYGLAALGRKETERRLGSQAEELQAVPR